MYGIDLDRLEKLAEGLALLFYVFSFMAFVLGLSGSAGSGFFLLVLAAVAHVGRAGLEEFVARQRRRDQRLAPEPAAKPDRDVDRTRRTRRAVA